MKRSAWWCFLLIVAMSLVAVRVGAEDVCAVCQKPITGTIYLVTDQVSGKKEEVCSNCLQLPRCFICGLPVGNDGISLPDGRHLCVRDGATAVVNVDDVRRIANEVRDKLDQQFSRFMSFPTNVEISVLDRIDVDQMFQPGGYEFESPNLLGCIRANTDDGNKTYSMRLLVGLPAVRLEATAAHEFSHAWVGDNVPSERHLRMARDAEEGFCELMAYLLMDSENEEAQKQLILQNRYTRGQIDLFIAAEKEYGLNDVLDWMQYGLTSRLREGHLDEVRNVKFPDRVHSAAAPMARTKPNAAQVTSLPAVVAKSENSSVRLQGIFWGSSPSAIVNDHTITVGDEITMEIDKLKKTVRCSKITENSVQLQDVDSGKLIVLKL